MTEPKRLFDCIEYHLERKPLEDMLAGKEAGQWKKYSTAEVKVIVDNLSAGLLSLGISCGDMTPEGRDKVAILCKNRPEWIMLDMAVQQIGAMLVPVYPTINVNELEFVLKDAAVKIVFVNDEDLFLKVLSLKEKVPSLKEIFTYEHVANARHWKEVTALSTPQLIEQVKPISEKITYEDLATIIYTSGTTGTPKGVMLSHRNILSNVMASIPCFPPGDELRSLSFLPLNHIFERMVTYLYLFRGTSIYYAESLDTIADNLKEVKPNMFTTVPRLLEKVYDRIMQKGNELTGTKRKLFFWAHGLAEKFEINKNLGAWYNFKLSIANKIIFSKWREGLGGNLKCVVTGGAACQVRLIRIFTAARIPIMEGYGLTETSPVISVNRYQESGRAFGTVGPLIDDVQVKIAEDGEILCKGPNIMMGYYKRPDLTAQDIVDGWFHTGDIGILTEQNFLKITDRKKELFKTSGGKYVAPLAIENKLKESPFIEQVMLVGADRKFVSALIVPSFANLKDWARKNNIAETGNEELVRHPKVIDLFKELVESFNKFFNHVEQVKKFELLTNEWSVDTGELTPKMSLKRKVVMEKYRDAIERIYS
ncbi:MAG: long-chain fatty acid--CoA ligase [Chitinophagaceae bacterium]|jgi:long-chain acyl-CoA synthetase|nr:long-chain fatty acid--CoA ligase [Chitinophagaceae bacterium]MBK8301085.1 long-chain fatty acid--CoA ligase [Chitinophagaceae bacterium]MBK9465499.1 long-chain fatty acid--CoA ligase [Chitinophagaceae bacterium]MBK9660757.1 long-chain fatty acid--CoA ligase [Chitinophagaceae bacterium]MBK9937832.1 long-chain fatty acid--CoA ligase [Chitinophagaceae bacterium]